MFHSFSCQYEWNIEEFFVEKINKIRTKKKKRIIKEGLKGVGLDEDVLTWSKKCCDPTVVEQYRLRILLSSVDT